MAKYINKPGEGRIFECENQILKDLRTNKEYRFEGNKLFDGEKVKFQFVRFATLDADGKLLLDKANASSYLSPGKGILAETRGNSLYCKDGVAYGLEGLWRSPELSSVIALLFLE